jgi:hypothetical protein
MVYARIARASFFSARVVSWYVRWRPCNRRVSRGAANPMGYIAAVVNESCLAPVPQQQWIADQVRSDSQMHISLAVIPDLIRDP